jgi:hypothetical protein
LAASSIVKEDLILLQSGKMLSRFGDIKWHNDPKEQICSVKIGTVEWIFFEGISMLLSMAGCLR